MTLSGELVDLLLATDAQTIPAAAIDVADAVFVDGVGVTIAGSTEPLGVGRLVVEHVRETAATPEVSVITGGFKTTIYDAAFANGTLAHALDFDNTWYPMNHPTSPVLPAILALAERLGSSGADCVVALVRAFEVQGRLRMASTGMRTGRGFHKPGTTGLMGAVAAACSLLGLDHRQTTMAFGIAGSRAGSMSVNTGTMTKSSHSGHAARMGLESAMLAARGFTASEDIFGPGGWFDTFLGADQKPDLLVRDWGSPLRMIEPGVGFKKYPANYFTHRCAEAGIRLCHRTAITASDLMSVELVFPDLRYIDRPYPLSGLDGKFSVQYVTAVALADSAVTIDSFTDDRRFASDIERLLAITTVSFDSRIPPDLLDMHVRLRVTMADGETYTEEVAALPGLPGNALTTEELGAKFQMCAGRVLSPLDTSALLALLSRTHELSDLRAAMDIARTAAVSDTPPEERP